MSLFFIPYIKTGTHSPLSSRTVSACQGSLPHLARRLQQSSQQSLHHRSSCSLIHMLHCCLRDLREIWSFRYFLKTLRIKCKFLNIFYKTPVTYFTICSPPLSPANSLTASKNTPSPLFSTSQLFYFSNVPDSSLCLSPTSHSANI